MKGLLNFREEPCGRDRRASEIEYLFSVSFPLVGNLSLKKDAGQAGMTKIQPKILTQKMQIVL